MRIYYCIAVCKVRELYDYMVRSVASFDDMCGQLRWTEEAIRGEVPGIIDSDGFVSVESCVRQKKVLEEMIAEQEAFIFQTFGALNVDELRTMICELKPVRDRFIHLVELEDMENKKESIRKAHKKGIRGKSRK